MGEELTEPETVTFMVSYMSMRACMQDSTGWAARGRPGQRRTIGQERRAERRLVGGGQQAQAYRGVRAQLAPRVRVLALRAQRAAAAAARNAGAELRAVVLRQRPLQDTPACLRCA